MLHPQKNSQMEKNAASLVMQGKILGYRVLLTGDVEKEGEEELLSEELERADILKAAHHGSKNSTSNEFLQKVQPKQTVISCGKQNRYGHPHLETIHRLQTYRTKIYRTDRSGAIIFSKEEMVENLQKKRYTIKSYRKRCKEYEENIRRYQDKYIRTFLSILRGRKIYDLPDEKPVKESISFRR